MTMSHVLLLGTKNRGKIEELRGLLREIPDLQLLTADDWPFADVEETGETFLANALLKAKAVSSETGTAVLAEDAGLEVAALDGAPGVRSARFSGEPVDFARNNALLLKELEGVRDRRARFVAATVVCLPDGRVFSTWGVLDGTLLEQARGQGGFGYDPLFVPDGETRTLAQMPLGEKNEISHRRRSVEKMVPVIRRLLAEGAFVQSLSERAASRSSRGPR